VWDIEIAGCPFTGAQEILAQRRGNMSIACKLATTLLLCHTALQALKEMVLIVPTDGWVKLLYMLSIREVLHHHQLEYGVCQNCALSDADIAEDTMLIVDLRCRIVSPLLMGSVGWPEAWPPSSGLPSATQAMSDTRSIVSETQDLHYLLFKLAGTS